MNKEFADEISVENESKSTHGTLYVMRERDYLTKELSSYYKIGIVNGAKEVEIRRKDHLTGNARDIFTVAEFTCLAVQKLETLLHNLFAKNRVHSGEWFVFSEQEAAVLPSIIQQWMETINKSLENLNGQDIPQSRGSEALTSASTTAARLGGRLAQAVREQKAAAANKSLLSKALVSAAGTNPDFAFMFKFSERKTGGSFSSAIVKDLDKKLWSDYMTVVEVKDTPKWDLDSYGEVALETRILNIAELPDSPIELHQLFLEAWGAEYRWKLVTELLKPALLVEGKGSAGIEGIYHWELVTTTSFDKKRFEEEKPEEFSKCISPKVTKPAIAPAEWASYKI